MVKRILASCYIYLILLLMYLPILVLIVFSFTTSSAIHTVGAFAALRQALAALGAVAFIVSGTLIAELALLAVFIAQALGAGITFLTV